MKTAKLGDLVSLDRQFQIVMKQAVPLRSISQRTGVLFYAFTKKVTLISFVLLVFIVQTGCVTIEKDQETGDGQKIPGKRLLDFAEYEYLCAPTLGKDHVELEQLLDRYGLKGWRLAGFMQKNGETHAFCMYR